VDGFNRRVITGRMRLRLNMISVSLLRVHGNPDPVDESCAGIASVRVTSASETY
jgi:hypothetical protein